MAVRGLTSSRRGRVAKGLSRGARAVDLEDKVDDAQDDEELEVPKFEVLEVLAKLVDRRLAEGDPQGVGKWARR